MPWIKRQYPPRKPYWPVVVIALSAVGVGILIGYAQWGTTAAIVNLVEKELTETQTHIKGLEKRMADMESRVVPSETASSAVTNEHSKVNRSDGKATRDIVKGEKEKEKQAWNKEPRF